MSANTAKSNETKDREIVITRLFNSPRAVVFDVWTDPKHLVHWWGPNGFTTTVQQMDVRPGGTWRMVLHGPDGHDYDNNILFLEVVKPERIVYQHQPGPEPVDHITTVTFEERDGKTLVTLHQLHSTAEQREFVVKHYNAIEGGRQTLGRLAEYLQMEATGKESFADKTIVLTRVFDAPRELVFKAWTDPKQLAVWWGPKGFTNPVCEADVQVGGRFRIVMRSPDGMEYPCVGVYQEIVPPERLVFTNGAEDAQGQIMIDGWTVAAFAEHEGGKTLLTLTTRGIARVPAAAVHLQGMEMGWTLSLEKLAALVTS